MPEQFSAKKTRRSHSVRVFSARKYRGGGGQKTRLESELLSAKKRHKGSQRARGLVATLVSKLALNHLTKMMSLWQTMKYKVGNYYQTNLAKVLERVVAHLRVAF